MFFFCQIMVYANHEVLKLQMTHTRGLTGYCRILLQQRTVWTLAQEQGCHRVPQRAAPHHLCDRRRDAFRDALRLWSDPGHRGQMGGSDWWEEMISATIAAQYVAQHSVFSVSFITSNVFSSAGSSHILTPTNFLNDLKNLDQPVPV